ncbi:MAG: CPBP family intramembrane metalloprotease [Actinobacteria bacterium]|nr:CPBP family intramembrane metalloprotease [Actinomycetota bacterium]
MGIGLSWMIMEEANRDNGALPAGEPKRQLPAEASMNQPEVGQPGNQSLAGAPSGWPGQEPVNRVPANPRSNGSLKRRQALIWLGLAGAGFVVGQVISGLLVAVVALVLGKEGSLGKLIGSTSPPAWMIVTELVGIWIGFAGAVTLASKAFGTGRIRNDMGLSFKPIDLAIGPATGLLSQVVLIPALYIPMRMVFHNLSSKLSAPAHELTGGFHGYDLVVVAALVVIVVPVIEELFFRGLLLSSLLALFAGNGKRAGPATAIIIGGILFGLAHFEPLQLLGLASFGVVLCAIAYRVRRIGPTILAHATFNLVAMVAIAVTVSQPR